MGPAVSVNVSPAFSGTISGQSADGATTVTLNSVPSGTVSWSQAVWHAGTRQPVARIAAPKLFGFRRITYSHDHRGRPWTGDPKDHIFTRLSQNPDGTQPSQVCAGPSVLERVAAK